MAALRENAEFGYRAELDHAIGAAIRHMKPRTVLSVIPLEISSTGDSIRRSWLMPLLHTYTSHAELAFYVQYFMPLATRCRSVAAKHKKSNNSVEHAVFTTLVQQIWALLPAFCTKPVDITQVRRIKSYIASLFWNTHSIYLLDFMSFINVFCSHCLCQSRF